MFRKKKKLKKRRKSKMSDEKTTEVKQPVKSKKVAEKVVEKKAVEKPANVVVKEKSGEKKSKALQSDVYDVSGKISGTVSLSEVIFGATINKQLLAQAVRVYLANQRQGTVSTKTRGEVDGSTRKIYRQKGTGKARHGSIRAPIFVKGGVVFGPKPRDYSLSLPKKMKRKALFSALSAKFSDKELMIVSGVAALDAKTKVFVSMFDKLGMLSVKKPNVLFVVSSKAQNAKRGIHNLQGIEVLNANQLNAYTVLKKKQLIIMQDALEEMEKTFIVKE
jgi:large subunit ribosomal protein L4